MSSPDALPMGHRTASPSSGGWSPQESETHWVSFEVGLSHTRPPSRNGSHRRLLREGRRASQGSWFSRALLGMQALAFPLISCTPLASPQTTEVCGSRTLVSICICIGFGRPFRLTMSSPPPRPDSVRRNASTNPYTSASFRVMPGRSGGLFVGRKNCLR